jgi:hypothetical protein
MPAVPVLPAVTGGTYSTSAVSALVTANKFLQQRPHLLVYSASPQSIPNNAATALTFDTRVADADMDGSNYFTLTGSKFTARYPGWYDAVGRYTCLANATGVRYVQFAVNGVVQSYQITTVPGSAAAVAAIEVSGEVFLNQGDYLEIWAFQNSGGALNTGVASGYNPSFKLTWSRV